MIPHYWPITGSTPSQEVKRLADLTGGVAIGHTATKKHVDLAMNTGKPILLLVMMHVNQVKTISDLLQHLEWLSQRKQDGLVPERIILHYEGPQMDQDLIYCWHKIIKEIFPDVPLGYYKFPGWDMGAFGWDINGSYDDRTVPAEFTCFNLYHRDVAPNNYVYNQNRLSTLFDDPQQFKDCIPVISHDGFYCSQNGEWHWQRDERRTPDAWRNLGKFLKTRAKGVWLYKSFYSKGSQLSVLEEDFNYYLEGLLG